MIRFILWLLGYVEDPPVGGGRGSERRGWNHYDGNGIDGWTVRHTSTWWDDGSGERVRLNPEGAKALGLWSEDESNRGF